MYQRAGGVLGGAAPPICKPLMGVIIMFCKSGGFGGAQPPRSQIIEERITIRHDPDSRSKKARGWGRAQPLPTPKKVAVVDEDSRSDMILYRFMLNIFMFKQSGGLWGPSPHYVLQSEEWAALPFANGAAPPTANH